jgi:hypothetical protein
MSWYTFIATNGEMPEIPGGNLKEEKYITVQEAIDLGIEPSEWVPWEKMDPNALILWMEDEDALDDLEIRQRPSLDDGGYTSYPFIYEIHFIYSELRVKQLLEYLKGNIRDGQTLELWRVWLGHDEEEDVPIPYTRSSYEELSLNHLIQLFNWKYEKYKEKYCLVIER